MDMEIFGLLDKAASERSLKRNEQGAFAPLAAVVLVIIMMVGVMALDANNLVNKNMKLRKMADIAALDAVNEVRKHILAGTDGALTEADLTTIATESFQAHLDRDNILTNLAVTLDYATIENDHYINLTYDVDVAKMVDYADTRVRNNSVAQVYNEPNSLYMDFHVLLDISGSMSTGATYQDQVQMWETQQCSFACHRQEINQARSNGITMRFEVLLDSLETLLSQATNAMENYGLASNALRIRFYRFRDNDMTPSASFIDLDNAQNHIDNLRSFFPILIDVDEPAHPGNTDLEFALDTLGADYLGDSGEGVTDSDRKGFVFLVTDGIGGEGALTNINDEGIGTLRLNDCTAIKTTGHTLGVVLLEYPDYAESMRDAFDAYDEDVENNHPHDSRTYAEWDEHFDSFVSEPLAAMEDQMRSCASPGFFYQASNGEELDDAMRQLFMDAVTTSPEIRLSYLPDSEIAIIFPPDPDAVDDEPVGAN